MDVVVLIHLATAGAGGGRSLFPALAFPAFAPEVADEAERMGGESSSGGGGAGQSGASGAAGAATKRKTREKHEVSNAVFLPSSIANEQKRKEQIVQPGFRVEMHRFLCS